MRKKLLFLASLILVLPLLNTPMAQAKDCTTISCYLNLLKKEKSVSNQIAKFDSLVKTSNGLQGLCNNVGRKFGYDLYKSIGVTALKYYSQSCGHAISYGILQSLGEEKNPPIDKAVAYCLLDENIPSCAYGVGLSLSQKDNVQAMKECELGFAKYDKGKPPTKSFQMSARGDCYYGYISDKMSKEAINSVLKINNFCKGLKSEYYPICTGVVSYSYVSQNPINSKTIGSKMLELKKLCLDIKNFECMQFVGKNMDAAYTYLLKVNFTTGLKEYQKNVNLICGKSKPCVEGMIQSHIVHTSHEEVYSICNGLLLKSFCLTTAKEHV